MKDLGSVVTLPHGAEVFIRHYRIDLFEVESRRFGEFVHGRDQLSRNPSAVGGVLRACRESGEA
jgi:hypothetical protein